MNQPIRQTRQSDSKKWAFRNIKSNIWKVANVYNNQEKEQSMEKFRNDGCDELAVCSTC